MRNECVNLGSFSTDRISFITDVKFGAIFIQVDKT